MIEVRATSSEPQEALLAAPPARDSVPAEGASSAALQALRRGAAEALERDGLPGRRDEAWRFTSVRNVVELTPDALPADDALAQAAAQVAALSGIEANAQRVVLTLVDGLPVLAADASYPEGLSVTPLTEAYAQASAPAAVSLRPERHFRALNTARFERGLLLHVRGELSAAVHVVYTSAGAQVAHPRVHLELEQGARCTLVEHFIGEPVEPAQRVLVNAVTDVRVGPNAELEHVRVHRSAQHLLGDLAVEVQRDGRYRSRVVTLGGPLMRMGLHVAMVGPGAEVALDGVYHAAGRDHVDHHTLVEHRASNCTSHEDYRGVVDEKGTAVFDGIAQVHREALVSEAHQSNRNLLLADTATVHTKPHLEIDTDSVVASHGATVGSLDADQLFFLRTRGLRESNARALLIFAFVRELIDRISDASTRDQALEAMASRLPDSAGLLELWGEVE